jgi:hypothetical protein
MMQTGKSTSAAGTAAAHPAANARRSAPAAAAGQVALIGRQLLLGLSGTIATISWLWINAPPPL